MADAVNRRLRLLILIVLLLLMLLLLPLFPLLVWNPPHEGFFHPIIVVVETQQGTITLTKWEWYHGKGGYHEQDLATWLQL